MQERTECEQSAELEARVACAVNKSHSVCLLRLPQAEAHGRAKSPTGTAPRTRRQ